MKRLLLTLAPALVLSFCAPAQDDIADRSFEWRTTEMAPPGEDGAPPVTALSLVDTDTGVEAMLTTCTGTASPMQIDGTVVAVRCWWAGGGDDYAVLEQNGALSVQTRFVDEEAGEGPWEMLDVL